MKHIKIGSLVTLLFIGCITTCLAVSYIYHPGTSSYDAGEGTVDVYTSVAVSPQTGIVEGQTVTFTATLNPIREGIPVVFKVDGVVVDTQATNSAGQASVSTVAVLGHHSIEAIPTP